MTFSPPRSAGTVLAMLATPCVVVAIAVMFFLNPIWVGLEQDRSGVPALTGYTQAQVRQATGSILSDLVFGPPRFDASVNGKEVLDARERNHMADVRNVLLDLGLVALVAAIVLAALGVAGRGRNWFWQGVGLGSRVTIVGVAVVGIGFAIFFEQAFELFHELFFSPGTYSFDPADEKLVQLFPDQFWAETSVAIALAVLGVALLVGLLARWQSARPATVLGSAGVPAGGRTPELPR